MKRAEAQPTVKQPRRLRQLTADLEQLESTRDHAAQVEVPGIDSNHGPAEDNDVRGREQQGTVQADAGKNDVAGPGVVRPGDIAQDAGAVDAGAGEV